MNTKTPQQQWLEYWRRSLKDAEKTDIEIEAFQVRENENGKTKNVRYFALINSFSPENESITSDDVLKECQKILEKLQVSETDVFISPLLIKREKKQYSAFSPFWYMARLDKNGQLSIPQGTTMPIIPRKYLSPTVDNASDENFILGDLDTAESAIADDHGGQFEKYGDYIGYIREVFKSITGKEFDEYAEGCMKERNPGAQSSFEAYYHTIDCTTAIIVFPLDENKSKNAGKYKYILELYNYLCAQSSYPKLLSKMIHGEAKADPFLSEEKWISINDRHLGQMKDDYPLSYSQRRSLYTILNQWDKPVHVVNGPPGTGKTTLLQSIVSDMVVKSVIEGEPCVIWGAAATNQAVTNIIESFSKGGQNIRWLPTNSSSFHGGYGTFFPSSSTPSSVFAGINYIGFNYQSKTETGTFAEIENKEYLDKAETRYLEQAQKFFMLPAVSNVKNIIQELHKKIETYQNYLIEITKYAQSILKQSSAFPQFWDNGIIRSDIIEEDLSSNDNKLKSIEKIIDTLNESVKRCQDDLKDTRDSETQADKSLKKLQSEINGLQKKSAVVINNDTHIPFLRRIFFGKKIHARNAILIEHYEQMIKQYSSKIATKEEYILSLREAERDLMNKNSELISQRNSKNTERSDTKQHIDKVKRFNDDANKWINLKKSIQNEIPRINANAIAIPIRGNYTFYDELDKLRAELFALSIRYWEGKWLLETKKAIERNEGYKDDKDSVIARFRRHAMLTPCFVSTFHSAPKYLSYWDGEARKKQYLTGFVDCLIIDEAGQASPEISMALFALAKRAVVVGDVKQIEPVWSILDSVDSSNLTKFGLKSDGSSEFNGRRCSCGSIMMIAQAACAVKDDSIYEKGNILLEHRRCLPEIIQYCSDLAYNGLIIPMREDKKTIFPQMAFYNVRSSVTTKQGNKRVNRDESRAICDWLSVNQKKIVEAYQKEEHEKSKKEKRDPKVISIYDCVGILTPFRGQKEQLYQDLEKYGFKAEDFKMGTVHALQGAARPIVLFSSVYTPKDNDGIKFFDKNVNMLNVAVSRAEDSFILFGDESIFKDKKSPSGKLFEIVRKHQLSNYSKSSNRTKEESEEYDVFISFSSKDQEIVDRISAYLKSDDHGLRVFMSRVDLVYHDAESFRVGLGRALQHSKMMLFILSNNFVRSGETRSEWNTGIDSFRLPKLLFQIDQTINWTEDDDNVRFFVSATGNGGQAIQAYDAIEEKLPRLLQEIKGILGK